METSLPTETKSLFKNFSTYSAGLLAAPKVFLLLQDIFNFRPALIVANFAEFYRQFTQPLVTWVEYFIPIEVPPAIGDLVTLSLISSVMFFYAAHKSADVHPCDIKERKRRRELGLPETQSMWLKTTVLSIIYGYTLYGLAILLFMCATPLIYLRGKYQDLVLHPQHKDDAQTVKMLESQMKYYLHFALVLLAFSAMLGVANYLAL